MLLTGQANLFLARLRSTTVFKRFVCATVHFDSVGVFKGPFLVKLKIDHFSEELVHGAVFQHNVNIGQPFCVMVLLFSLLSTKTHRELENLPG